MPNFSFTLVATGLDPEDENFEAAFLMAGCDDATLSFQRGWILVDFDRQADAAEDAIMSALKNARRAGVHIHRVEPDPLVNMSDIAARAGITRASVSHYVKGVRGSGFPSPVARITTDTPLWRWLDVVKWFASNGKMSLLENVDLAIAIADVNQVLERPD